MNQRLGPTAKEEIRTATKGLAGAELATVITHLAQQYDCSEGYIYGLTADQRRGKRKKRSDAGRRKYAIVEGTDTFEAASLVIGAKLDPDQALLTAKANGAEDLPALATFQKMLREHEVSRKQRREGRRNHRRFEAASPLEIVQIDCTALKVRWQDVKTRRILRIDGIDKNHPQLDAGKLRVWQIMAVDDHSRRRFLRYVATGHITSRDMVVFIAEMCEAWGLPQQFYTDNGPEFKGFFSKAITVLNSIPAVNASGGCAHATHAPLNPQASGKVEVAHQWAEKMDRYVGLAEQRGLEVTADKLNAFADSICTHYNESRIHRTTGQTPIERWHGTLVTKRMLPAETLRSALLFDESERKLTATMTIRVGKLDYRIEARDEKGNASPFKVGMRLKVIVPHELDKIFITLPNGEEYEHKKVLATADVAGEFRTAAQSQGEILTKQLKEHHASKNREAKERKKLTGEVYQVPHFNHEIAADATNVRHFPHPEIAVPVDEIAAATPVPMDEVGVQTPATQPAGGRQAVGYVGKPITFWDAFTEFADRFASKDECKQFLRGIFADDSATMPVTQVEALIDGRNKQEVASIRLAG